jgi:RNA polymerase-binding protein DksA
MIDTAKIKAALEAKLKELEQRAEHIDEDLAATPDSDWEDNATEHEDDEVLMGLSDVTQGDIREIKLALNRIAAGQYGTCVSCGESIPEARLSALPHTTTCVKCA